MFPSTVAKNVIIARSIPTKNPVTSATVVISQKPIRSTFGGPRTSSVLTDILSRVVFCIDEIVRDNTKSPYRDKYIRKVQDCKVFYCDKVDNVSDEDALIGMRYRSCEDQCISSIEKFGFFSILFSDIVIDDPSDQDDCEYLECQSANREREGNSRVI